MLAKIQSGALRGLECEAVDVEVDILFALPFFSIVGLPDTAIQEARERVHSAIKNSDFPYPRTRIVVNLAPAHLRKMGPLYDLPMALGILVTSGILDPDLLENTLVVGELALDGRVRPVNGIIALTEFARERGFKKIVIPAENSEEARVIDGIQIIPLRHLRDIISTLKNPPALPAKAADTIERIDRVDMSDIKGQMQAKRALEIAAAGGHNVLLNGAPGAGKTMMAKVMRTILPAMMTEEMLEVTKVYSVAGRLNKERGLVTERPFRIIHHTASAVSIVGGGNPPRPGEISLAHRGVLFLDELAEFPKQVLEVLRQPMEDRTITISRAQGSLVYPAQFTLIAAMNPCPCGYHNVPHPTQKCQCHAFQIQRYHKKISGPLLDRIDMHLFINPVDPKYFGASAPTESSAVIRERVEKVRSIQRIRFKNEKFSINSEMQNREIQRYCPLTTEAQQLLNRAMETFEYSARSYYRIIKIARTIADLDAQEKIEVRHLAEALQYRQKIFNCNILA
ncbi:YifB family Mg chelatase-like AAA ATPase [Candidatus Peregrinibacteria bacterium]|nr:YifB family Mg chelatase-like AAA ATPase [Candidatus Peregrinibacteria bacterium]